MKKMITFVLITLAATAAFAQDLPTHEEAARVIEGFWHCVGNGNTNTISEYATQDFADFAVLLMGSLDETQKQDFRTYKVSVISIERDRDGNYYCLYTDNNIIYTGGGPLYLTLTRSGPNLLIAY
jgi:hypothetical protein